MVWINRGAADSLRRQTSFSVFDADDANPLEGTLKGKIEVVRLINDHMAEARIVDDNLAHPMMFGDPIFSPTWEPGRPEHFALAGFIDVDNDGHSDRQRVRDMISHQRRASSTPKSTKPASETGEMSINTKYLVLGKEPTERRQDQRLQRHSRRGPNAGRQDDSSEWSFSTTWASRPKSGRSGSTRTPTRRLQGPRLPEGVQRVMPVDPEQERRNRPPTTQKMRTRRRCRGHARGARSLDFTAACPRN